MNPKNNKPENNSHIPEEIFDWISQFKFTELPAEHKKEVLQLMTEQEYNDFRKTVWAFQEADDKAAQHIEEQTNKSIPEWPIKQSNSPFASLKKLLHYQIPVYQVAACFLLLMGAFLLFNQFNTPLSTHPVKNKVGVSISQDEYPTDLIFEL